MHDVLESLVKFVRHVLQEFSALRIDGLDGRPQVDIFARLDRDADDVELGHQVLKVIDIEDAADRAGYRRRMRDDAVRTGGEVIAAAGGDIHQAGDDWQTRAGFERLQIAPHDVGRGHAAAGRMNPQHDGPHAAVVLDRVEPLAEDGHGIFAHRSESGRVGIEQHAVDVDHRDSTGPRKMRPMRQQRREDRCLLGIGSQRRIRIDVAEGVHMNQRIGTADHAKHAENQDRAASSNSRSASASASIARRARGEAKRHPRSSNRN